MNCPFIEMPLCRAHNHSHQFELLATLRSGSALGTVLPLLKKADISARLSMPNCSSIDTLTAVRPNGSFDQLADIDRGTIITCSENNSHTGGYVDSAPNTFSCSC
jgi:hypothetical protein